MLIKQVISFFYLYLKIFQSKLDSALTASNKRAFIMILKYLIIFLFIYIDDSAFIRMFLPRSVIDSFPSFFLFMVTSNYIAVQNLICAQLFIRHWTKWQTEDSVIEFYTEECLTHILWKNIHPFSWWRILSTRKSKNCRCSLKDIENRNTITIAECCKISI